VKSRTLTFIAAMIVFPALAIDSPAQTFTTLHSFDAYDGSSPAYTPLVQGLDGNLYGTTYGGGTNEIDGDLCNIPGCGTVFKITPSGTLTTLHNFCSLAGCADGGGPFAGIVLGTDGNFYGITLLGGNFPSCGSGCGTVFKITAAGKLTTLHSFAGEATEGYSPYAGLIQAAGGNFYGTTGDGGTNGSGTVFRITPEGKLTTLHSFDGTDGEFPYGATLVQATDGNFYGTTSFGGDLSCDSPNGCGTVFKITVSGKLTTLHVFEGTDGAYPSAGLVQATDGNFYGTTTLGGNPTCQFGPDLPDGCGTVFKLTLSGALTTLYSFKGTDGENPNGGLVQGTDGNFYGTTAGGGTNVGGTIFKITAGGELTTLYGFCSQTDCTDGAGPWATLVQATDGNFYGTTEAGPINSELCNSGCGTVFSLSVGLEPFVKTLSTSGKLGNAVIILGNNLTGAASVSFNGTPANFTVVSNSEIKTTVPAGAKTGEVEVTTPNGTLTSNVAFKVTPQISSFTPTCGAVGTFVTVTGTELTQTSQVTFDGVQATTFTVNSDSEVTAYVPTGAKTGKIAITTPGGTAVSSGTFTVTP
jgi:uncharacterized repeat protein (TIGR03803 family)